MRFGDEFDEIDDDIFALFGIDSYDEDLDDEYESMESFVEEEEE